MNGSFSLGRKAAHTAAVAGGVLIGAVLAIAASAQATLAEEVVIGAQFSLSGPRAAFAGPNLKAAAEVAVERINSTGLLGPDRTLKLILDDNAGEKTQAIALVNKQAAGDKVVAIVGPQGSDLGLVVAPVANDLKVPLIAIGGSNAIVEAGPWSFISMAPANAMAIESVTLAEKMKFKKVAVVFDKTNDSSVRMRNTFESGVKAQGITVVATEGIAPQDTNFGPLATKLVNLDVDAIYVESPPSVLANLAIQLRQSGLDPKVKILYSPNADSPLLTKIGGAAVNDTFFPTPFFAGSDGAENKRFVEDYRKRTGNTPDLLAALAYNSVMIVANAIRLAGPNADREKVREALGKLQNIPTVLGTGSFSIGPDRMPVYIQMMMHIVDGKPVNVPLQ